MLLTVRERPWSPGHRSPSMGASAEALAALPTAPARVGAAVTAHHVAVCDDDLRFIRYVERLLATAEVKTAPVTTLDPEEAARVVAASRCDAALIDLHMYNDELAGLTLVRLLRENPDTACLPLFMVTGESRNLKRYDAFLREQGCPVLPKPFEPDDLLASLGLMAHAGQAA